MPEGSPTGKKLLTAGIVMTSIGYGLSVIAGAVLLGIRSNLESNADEAYACLGGSGYNFLPIVGNIAFAASFPSHRYAVRFGDDTKYAGCGDFVTAAAIPSVIVGLVQLGGAAMLASGIGLTQTQGPDNEVGWMVRPLSPDGSPGLSVAVFGW